MVWGQDLALRPDPYPTPRQSGTALDTDPSSPIGSAATLPGVREIDFPFPTEPQPHFGYGAGQPALLFKHRLKIWMLFSLKKSIK